MGETAPGQFACDSEVEVRFMHRCAERLHAHCHPSTPHWLPAAGSGSEAPAPEPVDGLVGVCWRFNAWGGAVDGCYGSWDKVSSPLASHTETTALHDLTPSLHRL